MTIISSKNSNFVHKVCLEFGVEDHSCVKFLPIICVWIPPTVINNNIQGRWTQSAGVIRRVRQNLWRKKMSDVFRSESFFLWRRCFWPMKEVCVLLDCLVLGKLHMWSFYILSQLKQAREWPNTLHSEAASDSGDSLHNKGWKIEKEPSSSGGAIISCSRHLRKAEWFRRRKCTQREENTARLRNHKMASSNYKKNPRKWY